MLQAVIEGYLRPMLADNWDRGSLYSYRAFSFPSDMPYEEIRQPVMFITGEKDGALTRGAKKVCTQQQIPPLSTADPPWSTADHNHALQATSTILFSTWHLPGTLLNLLRPLDSLLCKVCICPCLCLLESSSVRISWTKVLIEAYRLTGCLYFYPRPSSVEIWLWSACCRQCS